MITLWLAHLALALLLFLAFSRLARNRLQRSLMLLVALLLTWLPVGGLTLALQLRSYTHDLSISLLVLLAALTLRRFAVIGLPAALHRDMALVYGGLALLLYPATLGLSYVDPYHWGFEPARLLLGLALLMLLLVLRGSWLALAMLLLATLAYALRGDGASNYWNYLIDPLLGLYALAACAKSICASALSGCRACRRPTTFPDDLSR